MALRADIAEGRHKTGDRLPTEAALSERFGVNRHTVRRALAELSGEGAVRVRRGSGAYVAEGVIDYHLGARVKFSQNVRDLGREPGHRLVSAGLEPADETALRMLRLKPGASVVAIEMMSVVDGVPVLVSRHLLPGDRFPDLAAQVRETASISAALARYGVTDYTRAWTRITARAPSRKVAAQLEQPESQPVLRAEGLNLDMSGQPVEYAVGYWAGGRAQFVVER